VEHKKLAVIKNNSAPHNYDNTVDVLRTIADTIGLTFGPVGANTLYINTGEETGAYHSSISKDGFSVLTKMILADPVASSIRSIILQSMTRILETAGDGTSTTTILIYKLFENIVRDEVIMNLPSQVRVNVLTKAVNHIKTWIEEANKNNPDICMEEIIDVISTSVNGDQELEKPMTSAVKELVDMGVPFEDLNILSSTDSKGVPASYEIINGYNIPNGIHGLRSFDGRIIEDASVIIINEVMDGPQVIGGLCKLIGDASALGKNLLIVTYGIKMRQTFDSALVQAYGEATRASGGKVPSVLILEYPKDASILSKELHDDFEALVGQASTYELEKTTCEAFGEVYTGEDMPMTEFIINQLMDNNLPTAKLKLSKSSVVLSDIKTPNEDNVYLDTTYRELAEIIETETGERKRDALLRRAKLNGKHAKLTISGENEWDISRKVDAVDDAIGAIKIAVKTKTVGGMSLFIPKVIHRGDFTDLPVPISRAIKHIAESYMYITSVLCRNLMDNDTFENVVCNFDRLTSEDVYLKYSFDLKELLSDFENNNSIEKYTTEHILNSVGAETKILEASTKAVGTLLSINQILLPDVYEASAYRSTK